MYGHTNSAKKVKKVAKRYQVPVKQASKACKQAKVSS